jgi:quercetin dioxygenase-like cupin family protein
VSAHQHDRDWLRDAAIQHAFGTLPDAERREFEELLAESAELRAELRAAQALAGELVTLVPSEEPPPGLWARIEARVAAEPSPSSIRPGPSIQPGASVQPWKGWREPDAEREDSFRFLRSARFERTATPGIEVRRLALDAANDRVTIEVRMAPGSSYPAHRHGGVEECYVLEGDLDVGGVEMRAGDFQRVERGSVHPVQRTRKGCRLLIVSSLRDELLDAG